MYMMLTDFTCVPRMTLYSSVFASPSRVRLAHESGLNFSTENFRHATGKHADVATLKAARELGMHYTGLTILGAAERNELGVVQFLHAQGCPWHWRVAEAAAKRSNFEMLRWIKEHGCDWHERDILIEAARSGNIEMTAWVKQQPGAVYDLSVMAAAARSGRTAMCEYLHTEQCPWDERACDAAAYSGHPNTLRWLHEHGCPWDAYEVCAAAAAGGSVDVMLYLQQEGIMSELGMLSYMLNAAGARNHLAAAQWLRQQGAEWPERLNDDGTEWSGDTLEWARAEGCTATTDEPEYPW
jgi:hypothetical protein